jgi:hypothetical protein
MSNQPLDKGRYVAVVEQYQSRELDQGGQPKMKNKYLTIGEATKWPGQNGSPDYVSIKQYLNPPKLPCETKIFWDSEQQDQQQAPQQPGYQQSPPQYHNQPPQHTTPPPQGYPPNGYGSQRG